MKRAERLRAVLDLLAETGQIEVDDIVQRLGVSPATARRDLDALASQQLLSRTRGGATGQSVAYDLPLRYKREQNAAQKQAIAHAASALVPRGAVVGLCGGTTSTAVATALAERPDVAEPSSSPTLTVVTNAINIAAQLVMRPQIKVVMTGGVVHPRSYELVGPYTDAVLAQITLDFAFIGVNGVDPVFGATVHDEHEAAINALMARRSERSVLVTDSSKIGRRAFASVGRPGAFDTIITDDGITTKQLAAFEDSGVRVIVA
ncbi:DeoR/GlpR family DNA-binding transcription regulator [Humibacter albus]|jgi:DeoR family transcriptional regulator of aga operon|uniref:DeoR/GlpR family DNA-binding transcription regulator n=1 Tax=Humibacter albus TaxID=427754 RepID=UPI0003B6639E|nr:DeoR/GlpR family DNA-binding transcription regulator [Humibacter albus]